MTHTLGRLKKLKKSLEANDNQTILMLIKLHHKNLLELISVIYQSDASTENKRDALDLFISLLKVHARAEEEIFYQALRESSNKEVRLESLRIQDEHEIAYEIMAELKEMNYESIWSKELEARTRLLTGLIKNHLKEEENIVFLRAENFISNARLLELGRKYRDKYKMHLALEFENLSTLFQR